MYLVPRKRQLRGDLQKKKGKKRGNDNAEITPGILLLRF